MTRGLTAVFWHCDDAQLWGDLIRGCFAVGWGVRGRGAPSGLGGPWLLVCLGQARISEVSVIYCRLMTMT